LETVVVSVGIVGIGIGFGSVAGYKLLKKIRAQRRFAGNGTTSHFELASCSNSSASHTGSVTQRDLENGEPTAPSLSGVDLQNHSCEINVEKTQATFPQDAAAASLSDSACAGGKFVEPGNGHG